MDSPLEKLRSLAFGSRTFSTEEQTQRSKLTLVKLHNLLSHCIWPLKENMEVS